MLSKEKLAKLLDFNQYGEEISKELEMQAEADGLVVVFGYSDDNVEFRGALHGEIRAFEGTTISFTKEGKEINEDDLEVLTKYNVVPPLNKIEASYSPWEFKTEIPHSTFVIKEDDDVYCFGIVFNVSDLK